MRKTQQINAFKEQLKQNKENVKKHLVSKVKQEAEVVKKINQVISIG